jgi:glycosyltransferase involved in cell wall biosynthesis
MRAVDASLVPLKNLPLFHGALPSKLFTSMGTGIPVLAALDGEARELVRTAQAGISVEPENPRELADAILRLATDPDLCQFLGQNGFHFVREHYDRRRIAAEFEKMLLDMFPPAALDEAESLPKQQLETR